MSYKSSDLEPSGDIVVNYDTFDLLRYMQENAMTITNWIRFNGSEPTVDLYPSRDIRVNNPIGFKTVLDIEYVPHNIIYKVKYKYTTEVI